MQGDDNGATLSRELLENLEEAQGMGRIEAGGRFVCKDDGRFLRECASEKNAGQPPTGEVGDGPFGQVGNVHGFHGALDQPSLVGITGG